uniref:Uncharacterized protein n=1 Tax=Cacopsylla melanoneura TaxID=428564 RepID=A0A8D9B1F1_9HEMI
MPYWYPKLRKTMSNNKVPTYLLTIIYFLLYLPTLLEKYYVKILNRIRYLFTSNYVIAIRKCTSMYLGRHLTSYTYPHIIVLLHTVIREIKTDKSSLHYFR